MKQTGPRIGEKAMSSEEMVRAFRELKRRRTSLGGIARRAGVPYTTVKWSAWRGEFSDELREKLSWVVRGVLDGTIRVTRRSVKEHVEVCACGRYQRCPCGKYPPKKVPIANKPSCEPLHTDVAMRAAAEAMIRRRLVRGVLPAVPPSDNGSPFASQLEKLLRK